MEILLQRALAEKYSENNKLKFKKYGAAHHRLTLLLDPEPNCEVHLCPSILEPYESVHPIGRLQSFCYPYQSSIYYEPPNPQPYLQIFTAIIVHSPFNDSCYNIFLIDS
jgi:hypothetical protein